MTDSLREGDVWVFHISGHAFIYHVYAVVDGWEAYCVDAGCTLSARTREDLYQDVVCLYHRTLEEWARRLIGEGPPPPAQELWEPLDPTVGERSDG